jgi:hypothetical protein
MAPNEPPQQAERCAECFRSLPVSELMNFSGLFVCAECKPVAVQKIAMGKPLGTAWRKGRLLVAVRNGDLPCRCVKCNCDTTGLPFLRRNLCWHTPWLPATVGVGVCAKHRRSRILALVGGLVSILGFPLCLPLIFSEPLWAMAGMVLSGGGVVWSILAFSVVTLSKIEDSVVHLGGACRAYLAELPNWPET